MCNCSKKCNCNITQITKGEKGDNGANAFKFVKEFEYDGETPISIPYAQITACASIPTGCFADGTTYDETVDYHVQLWEFKRAVIGSNPKWELFHYINYTYSIDTVTGAVLLSFEPEISSTTFRLVILA